MDENETNVKAAEGWRAKFARLSWPLDRFVLPLAIAGWMLHDRWGGRNDEFAIIVPVFLLLFRMYVSSLEQPICPVLEAYRPFKSAITRWNTNEVLGLFFLTLFEVAVALFAGQRDLQAVLLAFGWLFVPYILLVIRARMHLENARAMAVRSEEWTAEKRAELLQGTDVAAAKSEPEATV
jgi:hypothetical protein